MSLLQHVMPEQGSAQPGSGGRQPPRKGKDGSDGLEALSSNKEPSRWNGGNGPIIRNISDGLDALRFKKKELDL